MRASRIFAASLVFSQAVLAWAEPSDDLPKIHTVGADCVLVLPAGMRSALELFDPEFQIRKEVDYSPMTRRDHPCTPRQTPFAAVGDFNGDGKLDLVSDGDNARVGRRVLVLSKGSGYEAREIMQFDRLPADILQYRLDPDAERHPERGPGYGLSLLPKGQYPSPWEEESLRLERDGWVTHAFGKAAAAQYLEGDEVRGGYVLAD